MSSFNVKLPDYIHESFFSKVVTVDTKMYRPAGNRARIPESYAELCRASLQILPWQRSRLVPDVLVDVESQKT